MSSVESAFFLLNVLAGAIPAMVSGLLSRPTGVPYLRHVACAGLRAMSVREKVDFSKPSTKPSSNAQYQTYVKSKQLDPEVVSLSSGGHGLWIGSSRAKKVLLYFHGGGYQNPINPMHFVILQHLIAQAADDGVEMSVFILAYDLIHDAQYPTQLKQAVCALKHLLEIPHLNARDILVGGDSAGANLAIALLSHLSHRHPEIPELDLHGQRLGGVFLMSPWVSFTYDTQSAKANVDNDFITVTNLTAASNQFLHGAKEDEYTTPLIAGPEWWKDLKVENLLIVGGTYELFADDIEEFGKKILVHNPSAEIFMAQYEVHVQVLMDTFLGYPMPESEKYLRNWLSKVL